LEKKKMGTPKTTMNFNRSRRQRGLKQFAHGDQTIQSNLLGENVE
jgi:hypothetical protein